MEIVPIFIFVLLGSCIGSFLNVCVDRIPARLSLAYPPSHCDACGHRLSPWDLIPVMSYLVLLGRCRYCRTPIKQRVLWVEMGVAILLPVLYIKFGLSTSLAVAASYCAVLAIIGLIDFEMGLIPNRMVYPCVVMVAARDIILPQPGAISGIMGGLTGVVLLAVPAAFGGMGWGDVKMAGLIGLMVGLQLALLTLTLAVVLGGLTSIYLLLAKIKARKETIPFGPFLSIAALVTVPFGASLLQSYLNIFSF